MKRKCKKLTKDSFCKMKNCRNELLEANFYLWDLDKFYRTHHLCKPFVYPYLLNGEILVWAVWQHQLFTPFTAAIHIKEAFCPDFIVPILNNDEQYVAQRFNKFEAPFPKWDKNLTEIGSKMFFCYGENVYLVRRYRKKYHIAKVISVLNSEDALSLATMQGFEIKEIMPYQINQTVVWYGKGMRNGIAETYTSAACLNEFIDFENSSSVILESGCRARINGRDYTLCYKDGIWQFEA